MKKKIFVHGFTIVITCMLLSACSQSATPSKENNSSTVSDDTKNITLTMDKAAEVNTIDYLLEKYKTVTYAQLDYVGGNTIHTTYFKSGNENCGVEDDFAYSSYYTDTMIFSKEDGESSYSLSATKKRFVSDYMFVVSGGTFTSQKTDANGNLVCEAEADINQEYADQLSEIWPVTTKDKMVTTTVFAADDNRVLSIDFFIRQPDGQELKIASGVLLYNQEIKYTDAVKAFLDSSKLAVDVKMEDGSVRTAQIPEGKSFTWTCDDGYALYQDKEGNLPLKEESDPVKSDLTLYCLQKK